MVIKGKLFLKILVAIGAILIIVYLGILVTMYLLKNVTLRTSNKLVLTKEFTTSRTMTSEDNCKTKRMRRAASSSKLPPENRTTADKLEKKVRVLCWIMTCPENHRKKAEHVRNTWGRRCNKLLFMSTEKDRTIPTIQLPVWESRKHLWSKTKEAFKYIHAHHREEAEWYLKADDDTYVVLENLRYFLNDYNTTHRLYFGCRYKPYTKQGYMSGGAGYVLSRAALDIFVNEALTSPELCLTSPNGEEDINLGLCLENVGVPAMDTRDPLLRGRFFPLDIATHLNLPDSLPENWFGEFTYYPVDEGMNCCSEYTISFHYVEPHMMYELDYLIYHLRPYGIAYKM